MLHTMVFDGTETTPDVSVLTSLDYVLLNVPAAFLQQKMPYSCTQCSNFSLQTSFTQLPSVRRAHRSFPSTRQRPTCPGQNLFFIL